MELSKVPDLLKDHAQPCHRASLRPSPTSPCPCLPRCPSVWSDPSSRSVTASRCSQPLVGCPIRGTRAGCGTRTRAMLTVVVCAMLAGARTYAAIGEWSADLSAARRAALGFTGRAPGPVTIWRLLVRIDAAALDEVVCVWTRAYLERVNEAARERAPDQRPVRRVLAVDGKAMRATLRGTNPMHLLSALDQASGVVVAQVSVDVKTNEIPLFATLLDQIPDLQGTLVTGDALHAQVGHLNYLHKRGADLLVCVKGNQPTLRKQLKGLPWRDVPVGHTQTGRGHGRIEKRTVKVVTVEAGVGFPHAAQGIHIVRRSRPITAGTGARSGSLGRRG